MIWYFQLMTYIMGNYNKASTNNPDLIAPRSMASQDMPEKSFRLPVRLLQVCRSINRCWTLTTFGGMLFKGQKTRVLRHIQKQIAIFEVRHEEPVLGTYLQLMPESDVGQNQQNLNWTACWHGKWNHKIPFEVHPRHQRTGGGHHWKCIYQIL